jgi:hypothetical protein
MLLFKKKYLDAIRSGAKTQTIRLWQHCRMRTGQRSYIPGVGYIRVSVVEPVKLRDLTDQDAVFDGFTSARALRRELRELYRAELAAGYQAYRVRFEVLPPADQATALEAKQKRRKAKA